MRELGRALRHYPLLVLGAVLLGRGAAQGDSEFRALLIGVGCIFLGAGLALVSRDTKDDDDKEE